MLIVLYYIIFKQSYTVLNIGEAYSHINACEENKTELLINVMHAKNHLLLGQHLNMLSEDYGVLLPYFHAILYSLKYRSGLLNIHKKKTKLHC